MIGRNTVNLGWCGRFLFFVVPRQFSQVVGEWPENQILIPEWTYFHCPGTTLADIAVHENCSRNCVGAKNGLDWYVQP